MEEDIKFNHFMTAQIRFSDVDQFGHVNNSVYFSLYDWQKPLISRKCWAWKNGVMWWSWWPTSMPIS